MCRRSVLPRSDLAFGHGRERLLDFIVIAAVQNQDGLPRVDRDERPVVVLCSQGDVEGYSDKSSRLRAARLLGSYDTKRWFDVSCEEFHIL
jgi:hypothetical protein